MISSPRYWTAINMRSGGTHCWTKVLLERSKTHPITLHLSINSQSQKAEFWELFPHHAGRIRKLIIHSTIPSSPTTVWENFQLFMPEKLEVFEYCHISGMRAVALRNDAVALPLTGGSESAHLGFSTFQMRNITSLHLNLMAKNGFCDILAILSRNIPTLQHLELCDDAPLICMLEYPYKVTLPYLTSLSFSYLRADIARNFLDALILPAILSVTLRDIARAPDASIPKYYHGRILGIDVGMEGGLDLVTSLARFTTIVHLACYGVRFPNTTFLLDELRLDSLILVDCEDMFRSLICSIPAPINGWKNGSMPGLTRSAISLTELTVTSESHDLLRELLTKRIEAKCSPLRSLSVSPRCIHSTFTGIVKEHMWEDASVVADNMVRLAIETSYRGNIIPQPELGTVHRLKDAVNIFTHGFPFVEEVLHPFLPSIIPSTAESDSEGEVYRSPFDSFEDELYDEMDED